jgi:hypothetical protein
VGGTVDVVLDVVERRRELAAQPEPAAKEPPAEADPPPDQMA